MSKNPRNTLSEVIGSPTQPGLDGGRPDCSPAVLAVRHRPAIARLARRVAGRCDRSIDEEDLYQCGMLGLLEAASRYDVSSSASFWSFARLRIVGAMFDELRRAGGRRTDRTASISDGMPGGGKGSGTEDLIDLRTEPSRLVLEAQLESAFAEALNGLPQAEKIVFQLYYRRGLNQGLIAKLMHLTESRVHQIRSAAVARMTSRVGARTWEPSD